MNESSSSSANQRSASDVPASGASSGGASSGGASSGDVSGEGLTVSIIDSLDHVDEELVERFGALIPQLSSSSPPPDREALAAIVTAPDSALLIGRLGGQIVGSLTLATYRIPTGVKAWIEDVVVDESARGAGVGEALSRAAIDEARRRGAKNVSLTSRASREAANRLYQRIGFVPYDTNLYRFNL